jgi:hypothetical protein
MVGYNKSSQIKIMYNKSSNIMRTTLPFKFTDPTFFLKTAYPFAYPLVSNARSRAWQTVQPTTLIVPQNLTANPS